MRITRETPEELILDHAPWGLVLAILAFALLFVWAGSALALKGQVLGGLVMALGGVAVGGAGLAGFAERNRLWLHRPSGTLTYRRRTLRRQSEVVHPLEDLDYALAQVSRGSKGVVVRRPALLLAKGTQITLVQTFTNTRGPDRAVAAINRWLSATRGKPVGRSGA